MRYMFLLLMSLLLSGGLMAQEQKTSKEMKKEAADRKKAEKQAQADSLFKQTDTLVRGRRFVLEAQYLRNDQGGRATVSSNLNFISVDSLAAVIQVGSVQRSGYNGVGGVTVEGRVINWKCDKDDKHQNFYLTLSVQGNRDIYDIAISIDYSGYAQATISGINTAKIIFEGNLVPAESSNTYKGMAR
jgi:hypothetical protein